MAEKKTPLGRLGIVWVTLCSRMSKGYRKGTLMESTAERGLLQGLFL